jgi:hypothetical protein
MSTELAVIPTSNEVIVQNFLPVMDFNQMAKRYDTIVTFTQKILKPGIDYGSAKGATKPGDKQSLLKAGAEKFCHLFGLTPRYKNVREVEDFTGENHKGEPFFYYRTRCKLYRGGVYLGEGEGSSNSWESKHRWRWVNEEYVRVNRLNPDTLAKRGGMLVEFDFAIDKAETTGPYAKPAEYWQAFKDAIENGTAARTKKITKNGEKPAWGIQAIEYRVPNPDVADIANTCLKIAWKRSLIAAVLVVTGASEYFTQDIEDLEPISVTPEEVLAERSGAYNPEPQTAPQHSKQDPPQKPAAHQPAGQPTSSQAQSGHTSPAEPYLARILKNKETKEAELERVFNELSTGLIERFGGNEEAAALTYIDVFKKNGVKLPGECKSVGQLRKLITDLLHATPEPATHAA